MPDSIIIDLFKAYLANGIATRNLPKDATSILCPLCLEPIERTAVEDETVPLEHIIPVHSTKDKEQKTRYAQISVKNVRSGLTLTCPDCNGFKGKRLDFPLRNRITPGHRAQGNYTFETGTAILTYAYLFAFAVFGYEYILQPDMAEIREQFKNPEKRISTWLEYAKVHLPSIKQPIVCNEWGYPFILERSCKKGSPLELLFWRFRAKLPSMDSVKKAVDIPKSILRLVSVREPKNG